jgi:hypothetical protein
MAAGTLFHPTFLYESLWNIAGVLILLALDRRFHFRRGRLFWAYAMYYTLGRVWIEAMRIDDAEQINLFGITARLNVWTSILVFVVALAVFILLGMKGKPVPDSVYLDGREPAPEALEDGDERVRDTDPVVSDSESRDNLPDNQSGFRRPSTPTDEESETSAGGQSRTDSPVAGNSGSKATGTAPEAGSPK